MGWREIIGYGLNRPPRDFGQNSGPPSLGFDTTGTEWDAYSNRTLLEAAELDARLKAGMAEAEREGRQPYPNSLGYDGAQGAWTQRQAKVAIAEQRATREREIAALRMGTLNNRSRGITPVLTEKQRTHWREVYNSFFNATEDGRCLYYDPSQLSLDYTITLAAACDARLSYALRHSPFRDCLHVKVALEKRGESSIRPGENNFCYLHRLGFHIACDSKQMAKALLELDEAGRPIALKDLYEKISVMKIWGEKGFYPETKQDFASKLMKENLPPHILHFCECRDGIEGIYYRAPSWGEINPDILASVGEMNAFFAANNVAPIDLEPFRNQADARAAFREENKLRVAAGMSEMPPEDMPGAANDSLYLGEAGESGQQPLITNSPSASGTLPAR